MWSGQEFGWTTSLRKLSEHPWLWHSLGWSWKCAQLCRTAGQSTMSVQSSFSTSFLVTAYWILKFRSLWQGIVKCQFVYLFLLDSNWDSVFLITCCSLLCLSLILSRDCIMGGRITVTYSLDSRLGCSTNIYMRQLKQHHNELVKCQTNNLE